MCVFIPAYKLKEYCVNTLVYGIYGIIFWYNMPKSRSNLKPVIKLNKIGQVKIKYWYLPYGPGNGIKFANMYILRENGLVSSKLAFTCI